MLFCKYCANKDKASNKPKIVPMLSTCHQKNLVPAGKNGKGRNAVVKPAFIREYNLHMGGVDHVDQQLHSVSPLRKMYKWYKKLAIRIVMQMVLNARKICIITTGQKMTFLQFIKNVVLSWVTIQEGLPENMLPDEAVIHLTSHHFPSMLLLNPGAKEQQLVKRCHVCYAKGNRWAGGSSIRTRCVCNQCPSVPGLHLDKSFEIYHTKENYGSNDE